MGEHSDNVLEGTTCGDYSGISTDHAKAIKEGFGLSTLVKSIDDD